MSTCRLQIVLERGEDHSVNHSLSPSILLDVRDMSRQLSTRSQCIYRHDAKVFAQRIDDQGLTGETLSISHLSSFDRLTNLSGRYLLQSDATSMFSIARCIFQRWVYRGSLVIDPAVGIRKFLVVKDQ